MNISPTDLRISTHTATCNINSFINLHIVAKYLNYKNIKFVKNKPIKISSTTLRKKIKIHK